MVVRLWKSSGSLRLFSAILGLISNYAKTVEPTSKRVSISLSSTCDIMSFDLYFTKTQKSIDIILLSDCDVTDPKRNTSFLVIPVALSVLMALFGGNL